MRVYEDTPAQFSMMYWEVEPRRPYGFFFFKLTFDIVDRGTCAVAEEQALFTGPVPYDDVDDPSLMFETELAIFKPRSEWYLKGSACAVGGKPATVVPVGVKVGELEKRLSVWGDRQWKRGLLGSAPGDPAPFTRMPLRWERSFGGPGNKLNPAGCGRRAREDGAAPLPNIEDPTQPMLSRDDSPQPAGMFPIPPLWRARRSLTGTYDKAWLDERWPYLPADFDLAFFMCAPPDQQVRRRWRGDEPIELSGLHPEYATARTQLPGLRMRAFVQRVGPDGEHPPLPQDVGAAAIRALGPPPLTEIPLLFDTIVIDTDAWQVQCVWRGGCDVADDRFSDIARLFFVHEPMDGTEPHSHYEQWLLNQLLEDAIEGDEMQPEEPAPLPAGDVVPAELAEGAIDAELPPDPDSLPEEPRARAAAITEGMTKLLAAASSKPLPSPAEVEAMLDEAGIELDEDFEEPEPVVVVPELTDLPPSLLRLVVIVRRKLGRPFGNLDLTEAPLARLDLSGADFRGAIMARADLSGCSLSRANLDGANLTGAKLAGVDATEATLADAELAEIDAAGARFDRARLDASVVTDANLKRSSFEGASLVGTWLAGTELEGSVFRSANLDRANFAGATLNGSDFTAASMEDTTLEGASARECNFERVRAPNLRASGGTDLYKARFVAIEGPGAQLAEAWLGEADLSGSNLEGADLSGARAGRANFFRCHLQGARFEYADLREAMLMQVNAMEASFEYADLRLANLCGAHFYSAGLWRARLDGALLDGTDLTRTLLEHT